MEHGDLPLTVGERYTVLDDSRSHWWLVRDSYGAEGHAPSNYLKDAENDGIESMRLVPMSLRLFNSLSARFETYPFFFL